MRHLFLSIRDFYKQKNKQQQNTIELKFLTLSLEINFHILVCVCVEIDDSIKIVNDLSSSPFSCCLNF